jgi:hypothetical protein
MEACLKNGFVPCGIDRHLNQDGHPILLFGRLQENINLAPSHLLDNFLDRETAKAITQIDKMFRQR